MSLTIIFLNIVVFVFKISFVIYLIVFISVFVLILSIINCFILWVVLIEWVFISWIVILLLFIDYYGRRWFWRGRWGCSLSRIGIKGIALINGSLYSSFYRYYHYYCQTVLSSIWAYTTTTNLLIIWFIVSN